MVTSEDMDLIEIPSTESAGSARKKTNSELAVGVIVDRADGGDVELLEENGDAVNQLEQMDEEFIDKLLAPETEENTADEVVAPLVGGNHDEIAVIQHGAVPIEVVKFSEESNLAEPWMTLGIDSIIEQGSSNSEPVEPPKRNDSPLTITEVSDEASTEMSQEKNGLASIVNLVNDIIHKDIPEYISVVPEDNVAPEDITDVSEVMSKVLDIIAPMEDVSAIAVLDGGQMDTSAASDDVVFVGNDGVDARGPPTLVNQVDAPVDDEIIFLSNEEESVEMDPKASERHQAALNQKETNVIVKTDVQPKMMQVIRAVVKSRSEVACSEILGEELKVLASSSSSFSNEMEDAIKELRNTGSHVTKEKNKELASANRKITGLQSTVSGLMQQVTALQKQGSNGRLAPSLLRAPLVRAGATPQLVQKTESFGPSGGFGHLSPANMQNGGGPIRVAASSQLHSRALTVPSGLSSHPSNRRYSTAVRAPSSPPAMLPTKVIVEVPLVPDVRASLISEPFDALPMREYPPGLAKLSRGLVEIELTTEYDNFVISKKIHGLIRYNLPDEDFHGKCFRIYYFVESMHTYWQFSGTGSTVATNSNKFTLSFHKGQKLFSGDRITFIGYVYEEKGAKFASERVVFNFRRPQKTQPVPSHSCTEEEDCEVNVL